MTSAGGSSRLGRELTPLVDLVAAVVADAADVAAADRVDRLEQAPLGVPAVHHVAVVGLKVRPQHVAFVALARIAAAGHVDRLGHGAVDVELRVQPPSRLALAVHVLGVGRLGDGGQRATERAVDGRQQVIDVPPADLLDRPGLLGQLADDLPQRLGVEDAGRLGERAERGPAAAKLLADLGQVARLLDRPQRVDHRAVHEEQHKRAVRVHVQPSDRYSKII